MPSPKASFPKGRIREMLKKHHREAEGQVERLKQAFELLGEQAKAKAKPCKAMISLVGEGQKTVTKEERRGYF
jgi:ferritin-like metal-binding protein YciE